MEIFVLKSLVIGKLSLFSGMWNDALLHREGLKSEDVTHHQNQISLRYEIVLCIWTLTLSARGPSLDVRIWRLKTVPTLNELNKIIMTVDP